jgi:subfamily B ATP-binding cassette protein HlyB/CyaB
LSADALLWAVGGLCQLHRIPFDPGLILGRFPPPYSLETLLHAVQALRFKVALTTVPAGALSKLMPPVVALLGPKAEGAETAPSLALIVRAEAERLLLFEPGAAEPQMVSAADFAARYAGRVLLATPEAGAAVEEGDAPARAPFGFRWFVPELLKHRRLWGEVLGISLAIQVMALAVPLFTQVIIDKVIAHQSVNTLAVIAVALAIFMLFGAVLSWVRQYLVLHTGNRVDAVLAAHVFEHLFRLPARYFERRPTGTLVARVQAVETLREFVSGAAVTLLLDLPFLAVFLALMFWYSWQLTLVTLAMLGAIVALSLAITPVLRRRINDQFLLGARNQAFVTEYVSGMETVKSLQMEPQLSARYGDYLATYLQASFNTRALANTYNVAAHTLEQAMTLAILCLGAWIAMTQPGFTIGMLVAFQMFASRLSGPMLRLAGLWQELQQAGIAVKRLGDIMDAPAEPHALVPSREANAPARIEIQGLGFRYGDNLPWLYRDLSLAIEPGRCVAVMGPSGCGKSTLAKLLQGFYLPQEGRILLGGRDLRHLAANELRRPYGVVPQESVLFSGTVYENLLLANPHAGFEQVVEACKLAEIHEVVESLPQGYQTPVGEHGAGLSGGQKQRIAIARALLRRPRILIFDEATSSLDPATAEAFARTVNRLKGKVTLLFIAHQLPKGLAVDEVVTLGGAEKHLSVVEGERKDS